MRFLSILAITLCGASLAGCATNGGYSSPDIATSSRAGWGPHGKPLYYFMVMSNATPGNEEEFNRWYDRIHAPVVIEGGDFVWTQRFELSPKHFGGGTPALTTRQFMVIFAIETNDLEASMTEVNKRLALPRNTRSSSIDYRSLQSVSWKALGPPTTQKDAIRLLAEETAAGRVPRADEPAPPGPPPPFPGLEGGPGAGGTPPPGVPPVQ